MGPPRKQPDFPVQVLRCALLPPDHSSRLYMELWGDPPPTLGQGPRTPTAGSNHRPCGLPLVPLTARKVLQGADSGDPIVLRVT